MLNLLIYLEHLFHHTNIRWLTIRKYLQTFFVRSRKFLLSLHKKSVLKLQTKKSNGRCIFLAHLAFIGHTKIPQDIGFTGPLPLTPGLTEYMDVNSQMENWLESCKSYDEIVVFTDGSKMNVETSAGVHTT